nr:retrovirus-related Pol polyprotein from transposon TNT 1-94 [Tanacetum cinerariifolium]
ATAKAPKLKASARKKTSGSASSTTPPTPIATPTPTTTIVAAPRLSAAAKGKQPARATTPTEPTDVERTKAEQLKIVLKRSRQETHISKQRVSGTDEGTDVDEQTKGREESEGDKTDESDDDDDEGETIKIGEQKVAESDEDDDEATESDRESKDEETREQEEESFDLIPRTPEDNEDDDNKEEDQGLRIGEEERTQEEEDAEELYRNSDAQQESSSTSSFMTNLLNLVTDPGLESLFTTGSTTVTPIPSPQSTMTPSIMSTFTSASQLPTLPTQIPSLDLQSLPTFASVFRFEDRVKSLEDNFSNIPGIVNQYMHQQMPKVVREAVQTQTTQLQDSIQRENDEFFKTIDENMKKIIKEQVKTQVKAQVTRILPRIEEAVNAQLEAEVLTRSSHSSRTSYAVAADLSEMELKKILIEKMEGNKSDRGSKRHRKEGEHASASTPSEPATGSAGRTTTGSQSKQLSASADDQPIAQTSHHPEWFSQPSRPPIPDRDWNKSVPAAQGEAQSLGVDTLTPELLVGPTYELMRGSCNSLTELEYHLEEVYKTTTDQLDWVNPEGQQYPHNLLQPLPLIPDNRGRSNILIMALGEYGHIKWIEDLVPRAMWIQEPMRYDKHALWGVSHWGRKCQQLYGFAVNRESALDVYSKRRIIAVTELKIMKWHNYKHLDWISIRPLKEQLDKIKGKAVITEAVSLNGEAATLRQIVKSKRLLSPLNTSLDHAYSKATSFVLNSVSNVNSNLNCASSNGCFFFDNNNTCVNASKKSKSVKTPAIRKIQKTTGKVFKTVGHIWKPTGRTFTLVGQVCPLTRIATPTIVPPREPIPIVNKTDKPVVTLVVQIVLWYLDSGCSKHMTEDRSQLINYVQKFLGTVKFGNDHVAKIMGYGDYQFGNVTIYQVYYVEGLGHNLFFVGQFCDSDLEVAFCQHTCFIRNLDGVDLLTGSRRNNLYTLSLQDMMASSLICVLSKASKTKSWLWHRHLSHLNFGAINHLARQGLVRGLLRLKFEKDHLCSVCAMGKSTKKTHKPKSKDTNQEKLYLLHMDLCGLMRVEGVNVKSISSSLWMITLDSLSDVSEQTMGLSLFYEEVGISHETTVARSPQQNGVVERCN